MGLNPKRPDDPNSDVNENEVWMVSEQATGLSGGVVSYEALMHPCKVSEQETCCCNKQSDTMINRFSSRIHVSHFFLVK